MRESKMNNQYAQAGHHDEVPCSHWEDREKGGWLSIAHDINLKSVKLVNRVALRDEARDQGPRRCDISLYFGLATVLR